MRYIPFAAFLVFMPVALAQAQDETLFSRLSNQTLEKILKDGKIPFNKKESEVKGKTITEYIVTLGTNPGWKASLMNHGDTISMVSFGFKTVNQQEITLERVNEWNKKNFFSIAYVDKNGFGVLAAGLDMYAGTNQKIIGEWIKMYSTDLNKFADHTK